MPDPTEQKIIRCVLDIIGREGVDKVTIREIAKRAGVNIAAVNYYFGSKHNLIEKSLAFFIKETQSIFAVLEQKGLTAAQKIRAFADRFMDNAVSYPGAVSSLIMQMAKEPEPRPELAAAMKNNFHKLVDVIEEGAQGRSDRLTCELKAFQIMSSLAYPVLLMRQLPAHFGIDLQQEATRHKLSLLVAEIAESGR